MKILFHYTEAEKPGHMKLSLGYKDGDKKARELCVSVPEKASVKEFVSILEKSILKVNEDIKKHE